jgi:hypothetical protein
LKGNVATVDKLRRRYKRRVRTVNFFLALALGVLVILFVKLGQWNDRIRVRAVLRWKQAQSQLDEANENLQFDKRHNPTSQAAQWSRRVISESMKLNAQMRAENRETMVLTHWTMIALACGPALVLTAAATKFVWRRQFRRATARAFGDQCINCGYDLRGSTDRCPECGAAFERLPHHDSRQNPR